MIPSACTSGSLSMESKISSPRSSCPLCAHDSLPIDGLEGDLPSAPPTGLFQCVRCAAVFRAGEDRPAIADVCLDLEAQTAYYEGLYLPQEEGIRSNFRFVLQILEDFRGDRRGRLLDFGCATGLLLDEARKRGWTPVGIEVSQFALKYAKDRLGLEVFQDLETMRTKYEGKIDVLVLSEVVEHLVDPVLTLSSLRKFASENGMGFLSTPNWNSLTRALKGSAWEVAQPQGHLNFFTPNSLANLLDHSGYMVRAIWTRGCSTAFELRSEALVHSVLRWVQEGRAKPFFRSRKLHDPELHELWKRRQNSAGTSPDAAEAWGCLWKLLPWITELNLGDSLYCIFEAKNPARNSRGG